MKPKARKSPTREVTKASPHNNLNRRSKKSSYQLQNTDGDASHFITSTKQVSARVAPAKLTSIHAKDIETHIDGTGLADDVCKDVREAFSTIDNLCDEPKKVRTPVLETIFSPVFHMPNSHAVQGVLCSTDADGVHERNFGSEMREPEACHDEDKIILSPDSSYLSRSHSMVNTVEEGWLTSDGSSLFLAMQQTKSLECNDESSRDSVDSDEDDDLDDFDPYLFIKNLPDLSEVVSSFRPMLLPKKTRRCPKIALVLDLDETLVHSTLDHCDDADFSFPVHFNLMEHMVYVRCRPHLQLFMDRVADMFEIIVFTASQSVYAEKLLNILDPRRKLIRHRVYRESCVYVAGNYLKDLSILGRDLSQVVIIDNSPQAFGFQVDNGIPIESWFDDRSDSALIALLPFLESLTGVDDVRPIIAKKFNLRQKIAEATEQFSTRNSGDLLDRYN